MLGGTEACATCREGALQHLPAIPATTAARSPGGSLSVPWMTPIRSTTRYPSTNSESHPAAMRASPSWRSRVALRAWAVCPTTTPPTHSTTASPTSSSAQLPHRAPGKRSHPATWLVPDIPNRRHRCNRPTAARASGSDLRPRHREEPAMAVYATPQPGANPRPNGSHFSKPPPSMASASTPSAAASPPASFRRHASA